MYRHPSSHQKKPRTLCSHVFFGPLSFGMVRNSIQVAACWLCVRSVKSVSSPPLHANPGKSRMIPCRQQKQDVRKGTFDDNETRIQKQKSQEITRKHQFQLKDFVGAINISSNQWHFEGAGEGLCNARAPAIESHSRNGHFH